METLKHPLGVIPKCIHREHRILDLAQAIERHVQYSRRIDIPIEWSQELHELLIERAKETTNGN